MKKTKNLFDHFLKLKTKTKKTKWFVFFFKDLDHCADNTCVAFDDCHTPTCESTTGTCGGIVVDNGTPCEDGDVTTGGEQCVYGECKGGTGSVAKN